MRLQQAYNQMKREAAGISVPKADAAPEKERSASPAAAAAEAQSTSRSRAASPAPGATAAQPEDGDDGDAMRDEYEHSFDPFGDAEAEAAMDDFDREEAEMRAPSISKAVPSEPIITPAPPASTAANGQADEFEFDADLEAMLMNEEAMREMDGIEAGRLASQVPKATSPAPTPAVAEPAPAPAAAADPMPMEGVEEGEGQEAEIAELSQWLAQNGEDDFDDLDELADPASMDLGLPSQ
jgi:hypothetical protein